MSTRLTSLYRSVLPPFAFFVGFSAILWVGHRVDRGMRIFRRDAIQSIEKAQQSGDMYYRSRFDSLERAIERLESKIDSMEERARSERESNAALRGRAFDPISTAGAFSESFGAIENSTGNSVKSGTVGEEVLSAMIEMYPVEGEGGHYAASYRDVLTYVETLTEVEREVLEFRKAELLSASMSLAGSMEGIAADTIRRMFDDPVKREYIDTMLTVVAARRLMDNESINRSLSTDSE